MIARSLLVVLLFFVALFHFRVGYSSTDLPEGVSKQDGWHSLRQGFQLMEHYNHKAVARELGRFSQHYFNRLNKRITAHQGFLNARVQGRKIPAELALVPLIESALDGHAISPASAAGIWQLMPDTARAYGLNVSLKRDDRKDIVKATEAALNLLESLYDETGDWLLAIAAYNVGIRRIHQAVSKNINSKTGFWELSLPRETREFVARLLALSQVVYEPQRYGLKLPVLKYTATHY